jgi:hypothetical protein
MSLTVSRAPRKKELAMGIHQIHDGHRRAADLGCHAGDVVKILFSRGVEETVCPKRCGALNFRHAGWDTDDRQGSVFLFLA